MHEIKCKVGSSCISWNPSRNHAPMIAVGSDDASLSSGGKVQIHEYNESSRKWLRIETLNAITEPVHDVEFAPNLGRSYHLLGIACNDVKIATLEPLGKEITSSSRFSVNMVAQFKEHSKVCMVLPMAKLCHFLVKPANFFHICVTLWWWNALLSFIVRENSCVTVFAWNSDFPFKSTAGHVCLDFLGYDKHVLYVTSSLM